jgi:hypothetical protein
VRAGLGGERGFKVTRTGPNFDSEMCWRLFIQYVLCQKQSAGAYKHTWSMFRNKDFEADDLVM